MLQRYGFMVIAGIALVVLGTVCIGYGLASGYRLAAKEVTPVNDMTAAVSVDGH